MTELNEGQKYHRLMLAFHGLAEGQKSTDRIFDKENDGYGRTFAIDKILADTVFVTRTAFESEDVFHVKAAFARLGKPYPGANIAQCVRTLLLP